MQAESLLDHCLVSLIYRILSGVVFFLKIFIFLLIHERHTEGGREIEGEAGSP